MKNDMINVKIFCDLDGTLLDVSDRNYSVYLELITKYNGKPLERDIYWDLKRKKTRWPELLPMSGVAVDQLQSFLDDFIQKIESLEYLKLDTLFPSSLQTLDKLSEKYDCALVSLRRNEANLLKELEWLGIRGYFSKVLSGHSESDGYDKKIQLITSAIEYNNKGVVIGDTEADIVTGKELGFTTIAITSGVRDRHFLSALRPDYLLGSIGDVPSILLTDYITQERSD